MFLVVRKSVLFGCALAAFVLALCAGVLCFREVLPVFSTAAEEKTPEIAVIVIDPGHGGEDSGAVSPEGIAESGINLDISRRIYALTRFFGQEAVMTRTEDVSIGDAALPTVRQRKSSDLRRRVEIVNQLENALLLSVHQNSLPSSPVTHGAQVFWNRYQGGETLAKCVQNALNEQINAGNPKQAREMDASVYLMRQAAAPAALVECGFLSNAAETMQLLNPGYQTELALAVTAGTLRYIAGENPA